MENACNAISLENCFSVGRTFREELIGPQQVWKAFRLVLSSGKSRKYQPSGEWAAHAYDFGQILYLDM